MRCRRRACRPPSRFGRPEFCRDATIIGARPEDPRSVALIQRHGAAESGGLRLELEPSLAHLHLSDELAAHGVDGSIPPSLANRHGPDAVNAPPFPNDLFKVLGRLGGR